MRSALVLASLLLAAAPPAVAHVGGAYGLAERWMLEASLLENLFVFDNSPDVGFHVGLVWRSATTQGGPRSDT